MVNDLEYVGVYFVRICVAGLCGLLIGTERERRTKAAGVRTHFMIAIATALMMIISKYGFNDVAGENGLSCDVSRVAAGIITGVGLLGGGLIFIGKQGNVSGITTASGVWVTIAIGMTVGAGMYVLGIGTTGIVLAAQFIFHSRINIIKQPIHVMIVYEVDKDDSESLLRKLEEQGVKISSVKWTKEDDACSQIKCQVLFPGEYTRKEITEVVFTSGKVESLELAG